MYAHLYWCRVHLISAFVRPSQTMQSVFDLERKQYLPPCMFSFCMENYDSESHMFVLYLQHGGDAFTRSH